MNSLRALVEALGFVIATMVSIGMCAGAFVVGISYAECRGFSRGTGIETKWEWGCYAKVDGQWVPKQYAFGDAHEIRMKQK